MNWAIKYRPKEYEQLALAPKVKKIIDEIIKTKHMGDFLFYSPNPGCGKTSLARMLPELLDMEVLFINASKDGNMDTIKNEMKRFTEYASMCSNGKLIILDEAERITPQAQQSLRGILEEEKLPNLHYVFTANDKSKLIEPIANSRLLPINFTFPEFNPKDKYFIDNIFKPIVKYLEYILNDNNIEYKKQDIMKFVKAEYPGVRRMVVKMEFSIFDNWFKPDMYGSTGILLNEDDIINCIKNGDDEELYLLSNKYNNGDFIIEYIKEKLLVLVKIESIGKTIEILNEYQTNNSLSLTFPKINFLDMLYKLKRNIKWR